MDTGTIVYRAELFTDPISTTQSYCITTGEVSGVVVNSVPMIRVYDVLVPLVGSNGTWRETKSAAKRDAWRELVRRAGALQAKADEILAEIEHEDLSHEESAA